MRAETWIADPEGVAIARELVINTFLKKQTCACLG
jgi:hypothetical protein